LVDVPAKFGPGIVFLEWKTGVNGGEGVNIYVQIK
jgi:hypothetical protein